MIPSPADFRRRADAALAVLAIAFDSPRRALPIFLAEGITADDFEDDDLRCLFFVLERAGDARQGVPPLSRSQIAHLARAGLRHLNLWDDDDFLPFHGGMRWGPGPLAAFLCRATFDTTMLQKAATALRFERRVA
jgi:hypothetical protein